MPAQSSILPPVSDQPGAAGSAGGLRVSPRESSADDSVRPGEFRRDGAKDARAPGAPSIPRTTRAKLMIVVPLTMTLLVASTGFFTLSMTQRAQARLGENPPRELRDAANGQIAVQVSLISLIAAILGFSISYGITMPLREVSEKLEALAAGDLREPIEIRATSEFDSLAGAFNDVVAALNRYVFQSMTGAVVTLNSEGRITGYSPAAEIILGYREEEVLGRRFSEIFAPARGDRASLGALESAILSQRPFSLNEAQILTKSGKPVRIGMSVSYLRGEGESVIGVMITFKDLTEIRRLREQFRQADQLVVLGTLTAGVAHELRNPLGAMQGLVELLAQDLPPDASSRKYIDRIVTSIDRLNRLVEDLLLFSSPVPVTMEPVALDGLVRETVALVRHDALSEAVDLSETYGASAALVSAHADKLSQALLNILRNAIQATPAGGCVSVATARSNAHVSIAVHNTGSFIPAEHRGDVFVPFYSTKTGGTGLGLSIARQIVLAHGGRIDVASDRKTGTTFTIELPVAEPAETAAADLRPAESRARTTSGGPMLGAAG